VLFLLLGSQSISSGDKDDACLMLGRLEGQSTALGAYPSGASDDALFPKMAASLDVADGWLL
jgi:hypothetical protein